MLHSLTGVRAYAAALVFFAHLYHLDYFGLTGFVRDMLAHAGNFGVSTFFVLSGFVLVLNYPARSNERWSVRKFYVARFARVYPIFLITSLLALPIELGRDPFVLSDFARSLTANVTVTQCLFDSTCGTFNDVNWSITVEGAFYVFFPALSLATATRRSSTMLVVVALGIVLLSTTFLPGFHSSFRFPLNRLFEFSLGMAAGRLRADLTWLSRLATTRACGLVITTAVGLCLVLPPLVAPDS